MKFAWAPRLAPLSVVLTLAVPTWAAPKDEAAEKLAEEAIFNDYLALEIDAAIGKLEQALDLCGDDLCNPRVMARLYRDLGVVTIAGKKKIDEGKNAFVQALMLDPKVKLDPDLSTPEIEAAWNEASSLVAGQAPSPPAGSAAPAVAAVAEEEPQAAAKPDDGPTMDPDCPPDFPGCEDITSEPEPEKKEEGIGFALAPTLAFQQDFLLFPTADEANPACTNAARLNIGLTCYYGDGTFRDPAVYGEPLAGGRINGGPTLATMRILAGVDVNGLIQGLSLGVRFGLALNGGPTAGEGGVPFLPVHVEARAGYYFLDNPFKDEGLHPYAAVSGGLAQVDARINTRIGETCMPGVDDCAANGTREAEVQVWTKTGTVFLAPVAGLFYNVAGNHGPYLEGKAMIMLGTSGFGFSATLGYSYAFDIGPGPAGPSSSMDDDLDEEEYEEPDESADDEDFEDSGWE